MLYSLSSKSHFRKTIKVAVCQSLFPAACVVTNLTESTTASTAAMVVRASSKEACVEGFSTPALVKFRHTYILLSLMRSL